MLKKRIEKMEDRQPKPEPENIKWTAYYGGQEPERPGKLIDTRGNNPCIETYELPDGSQKEVWHYKSHWPVLERADDE